MGPFTLGYDEFNRLNYVNRYSGAQTFNNVYDRYGNRWQQNAPQGGGSLAVTFNQGTNQINSAGFSYNSAGELTNDSFHSYSYDAEGNLLQVDGGATAQYVYDALNHRVRTQDGTGTNEYLYDPSGKWISTWVASSNWGSEGRIYWGNQQFAFRSNDGTTYFDHQDWTGTERVRTNCFATVSALYASFAYGDDSYAFDVSNPNSAYNQDNAFFAGLDYDSGSGTDHAMFRQYTPQQGRWMSPDPYSGSYDMSNPQSMNRYSYVLNNPVSFTDPSGLDGDPVSLGGGVYGCTGAILSGGHNVVADIGCGWSIFKEIEGLFGGPSFHGSLKSRPATPSDPGSFGESLGIPTSIPKGNLGLGMALGLPSEVCEFGACGAGPSSFGPGGPSQGPNPLQATSGAISFSGIWAVFYGLTGPATTVSYDPKNHLLCGGLGWGVSGGHNFSIGPVVIHAKPGNTSEDVLGGGSWSGGWNITPWWGVQGSTNSSGYTAGYSYGVPGISGAWTYSGCKHVGG